MTVSSRRAGAVFMTMALVAAGCGGGTGAQHESPQVASLEVVSGDEQSAVVGTALSAPVVVRVTDPVGRPISGQVVNFRVQQGGGSVFAGVGISDASGSVRERWTLGVVAGPQQLEARAVDSGTGAAIVFATFTARALAAAPASLALVSGSGQAAAPAMDLPLPIVVAVVDQHGNPVPGAATRFSVVAGGGAALAVISTDASGRASATWTLGPSEGEQRLEVRVADLAPIEVAASAALTRPAISLVWPEAVAVGGGEAIQITGAGFSAGATVLIGGVPADVTSVESTRILALSPPHAAGAVVVTVTNPDGLSGSVTGLLTYSVRPTLDAFARTDFWQPGLTLCLTGTGFKLGAMVWIGATYDAAFDVTATRLCTYVPQLPIGTYDVKVVNPDGLAASQVGTFTSLGDFVEPPCINDLQPTYGSTAGGTVVGLWGPNIENATVDWGGVEIPVLTRRPGQLTLRTPPHPPGHVTVTLTNPDGQQCNGGFHYLIGPVVETVSPVSGPASGGTTVTITGSGFVGEPFVFIGSQAVVLSATESTIVARTTSTAAGTYDVTVLDYPVDLDIPGTLPRSFTYTAAAIR